VRAAKSKTAHCNVANRDDALRGLGRIVVDSIPHADVHERPFADRGGGLVFEAVHESAALDAAAAREPWRIATDAIAAHRLLANRADADGRCGRCV
jgi:hypothetical protein